MKKSLYTLFLIPLCIISMLTIIYIFAKDEPLFFLKNIKVNGIQQLKDHDIMGRASPFLRDSLFKIDISKMKEAIISHPFVKEVRIKRVYPFSLVIDVEEKKPSALWADGEGQLHVLDEYGEPFRGITKGDAKGLIVINAREKNGAKSAIRTDQRMVQGGDYKARIPFLMWHITKATSQSMDAGVITV
ncbi:MAG: FtsQ-type POTRA domain-containing protein [Candidatus Moduliflexus flocculans]|nr:FtsQ-type POTRA domain-containing protein [Candidatus Moduliflexus flocculans]